MLIMRHNLDKVFFKPDETLGEVIERMAQNKAIVSHIPAGIGLIVDKNKKLLGVVTDGDIRRSLSKKVPTSIAIGKIMNQNPFTIEGPKSSLEVLSLVAEKIRKESWHKDRLNKIIIVNKNKEIIDLVSFYDLWQKSDIRFKQIGVVGLGYVGLTLALTLADLGFKVKGFDNNSEVKAKLRSGRPHFFEDGLESILKDNLKNHNFSLVNGFFGVDNCDIYFIAVGTPLNGNKKPDLSYLKDAARTIGQSLKSGDSIILRSTVPVGSTRKVVVPVLEKESNLKAGEDFFVAFAPERTVEGKALEELRNLPQVIGGINWASADLASNIFSHMTHSVVLVDSLEEAEMVKLINNTYRDVIFSFANELSLICHKLGIDTRRVIEAANRGYDRSRVPQPSPGVGGVCLEKDPLIFAESAKAGQYSPLLPLSSRKISENILDFVRSEVESFINKNKIKNPKILIMGLAFKGRPVTSDIRGSTAVTLINKLGRKFKNIQVYDPAVSKEDIVKQKTEQVKVLKNGFRAASVIVVMNNNPAFETIDIRHQLKLANKPCFLFDCWGLYNREEVQKEIGVTYKRL